MIKYPYITMLCASLLTLSVNATANQSESIDQQIQNCAVLTDDSQRLACFDAIAQATNIVPTQELGTEQVNENQPQVVDALPDTLGGRKFDPSKDVVKSNRGKVVSCKKSYDSRWFFIFENGQVWKQTDRRQRHFKKDCAFQAILIEDGFGYKMTIEGKSSKIRVKRTK